VSNWITVVIQVGYGRHREEKEEKQQVYLVSSSREKGVWHIERSAGCLGKGDNQMPHIEIEKGMLGEARKSRGEVT
jgi:hypothetical protein